MTFHEWWKENYEDEYPSRGIAFDAWRSSRIQTIEECKEMIKDYKRKLLVAIAEVFEMEVNL